MRAELSLPVVSGQKDLFAFMRLSKNGLSGTGVVGEVGEPGTGRESSLSVLWLLLSVAPVEEYEAEEVLVLREGGCRAVATAAISTAVRASPPPSALMRFFAFLRSRFLSFGVVSGSVSTDQELEALLLVGVKGEPGEPLSSMPCSCWSRASWRRSKASCLWRSLWALLLRRQ